MPRRRDGALFDARQRMKWTIVAVVSLVPWTAFGDPPPLPVPPLPAPAPVDGSIGGIRVGVHGAILPYIPPNWTAALRIDVPVARIAYQVWLPLGFSPRWTYAPNIAPSGNPAVTQHRLSLDLDVGMRFGFVSAPIYLQPRLGIGPGLALRSDGTTIPSVDARAGFHAYFGRIVWASIGVDFVLSTANDSGVYLGIGLHFG